LPAGPGAPLAPRAGAALVVESGALAPRPRPLSVGAATVARPPPRPPGRGWSRSRQESGRAPNQRATDSSNGRGETTGRFR